MDDIDKIVKIRHICDDEWAWGKLSAKKAVKKVKKALEEGGMR